FLQELIQNAEDASASEMKILYDNRQRLLSQNSKSAPYTKYFQSPALCVHNNEYFTKKDWDGIKQIGQSVKELDPSKVGRFGLGFKSVFHITDQNDVKKTIVDCLESYNVNLVKHKDYKQIYDFLVNAGLNPQTLTQDYLSRLLRSSDTYRSYRADIKDSLLMYLVARRQYALLDNLELLPLANGSYTTFQQKFSVKVYMCYKDQQGLFPGMEKRIIKQLPQTTRDLFLQLAKSGIYQLAEIQEVDIISLMRQSITSKLGGSQHGIPLAWPRNSQLDVNWLKSVWKFFTQPLRNIPQDLPILPQIIVNGERYLHTIGEPLILQEHYRSNISAGVVRCLKSMAIVVLPKLPVYVTNHPHVMKSWIELPNLDGVLKVLADVNDRSMSNFNDKVQRRDREELVSFLGSHSSSSLTRSSHWSRAKKVLQRLNIFHSDNNSFLSIIEECRISQAEPLPVPLPFRCLTCMTTDERNFARSLGAQEMELNDAMEYIFKELLYGSFYNDGNKTNMMKYFMKKFHQFKHSEKLMSLAMEISFVLDGNCQSRRPCDLFDPRNKLLVQMLNDSGQFPRSRKNENLDILTKLGLRTLRSISSREILKTASNIHDRSSQGYNNADLLSQATALIKVLGQREELLTEWYLHDHLAELQIISPLKKPRDYPHILPWYTSKSALCTPMECAIKDHLHLVGSTMPLFSDDCSKEFIRTFHPIEEELQVTKIIEQLYCVIKHYEERSKPELLLVITKIYKVLDKLNLNDTIVEEMMSKKIVWMGHGFCCPNEVYLDSDTDDLHLEPYVYKLPTEVDTFKDFFRVLGCMSEQCPAMYLDVQRRIQKLGSEDRPESDCQRDLRIVISILNYFKNKDSALYSNKVLLPIQTSTKTRLKLHQANECNYCNEEWLKDLAEEEGDEVFYVHRDVPVSTATILGAKSLTDSLLEGSLMDWEQELSLVDRIKSLLKGYKDGFSVPKELIQNADDAGASKVCFLYDERENLHWRHRLINDKLKECQGPALWAFNDALFSENDMVNITKVEGATKEGDLSKTGKFGVGFCSVYNLTDVPSFVSGQNMVIFDPQGLYLTKDKKRGMKIDFHSLKNRTILRRMSNQFNPFNGIFDCNLNAEEQRRPYFHGSLFRFPLRTNNQRLSEISNIVYNQNEMKSLLNIFMQSAGNLLLFTQSVKEIELYHLPVSEKDPKKRTLIFKVTRELKDILFASPESYLVDRNKLSILKVCAENISAWKLKLGGTFTAVSLTYFADISVQIMKCDLFPHKDINSENKTKWVISWATGSDECLQLCLQSNLSHTLPIASTAILIKETNGSQYTAAHVSNVPEGFYKTSHLFSTLPLPVETPFPFHVNGFFAITQDRKQLSLTTVEDKQKFESAWNHGIMRDAVVTSVIQLLNGLKQNGICPGKYLHSIWPLSRDSTDGCIFSTAQRGFLMYLLTANPAIIYHKESNEWISFDKCKILDEDLLESHVGEQAYKYSMILYKRKGYYLTKIPGWLLTCIKDMSDISDKIITMETFYSEVFFPALESEEMQDAERDKLLLFAVDMKHSNINAMLKTKHCLPCSKGILCKPSELILPFSPLGSLFLPEDGRFLIRNEEYHREDRVSSYKVLGMVHDILPEDWLIERIESIQNLLEECSYCAVQRCRVMMEYLSNINISAKGISELNLRKMQSLRFLPVMMKPRDWTLKWKGEENIKQSRSCTSGHKIEKASTIRLPKYFTMECPLDIFFDDCRDVLGCVAKILHLQSIQCSEVEQTLKYLGVRGRKLKQIPIELMLYQLKAISDVGAKLVEYTRHRHIFESLFKWLEQACQNSEKDKYSITSSLQDLKEDDILFLNNKFWKPSKVCKSLKNSSQCDPHLVGIEQTDSFLKNCPYLLSILSIQDAFSSKDIARALINFQSRTNKDLPLNEQMLDETCGLLEALYNALESENIPDGTFEDLKGGQILIPDVEGLLRPVSKLCLDDDKTLRKTETMFFVYSKIPPSQSLKFGIRTKMRRRVKDLRKRLPFGQKVELTNRINSLLDAYPADEGILKELLQNADDASASEIHFITDFNNYSDANVFEGNWKELQGPSLLVFNNSSFTESDLEGIQHLGEGSKLEDPTKTGQYGVGFNAVYHLTDVPSFITKGPDIDHGGETLCALDPQCMYAEDADEDDPGIRYGQLDDLRLLKPDVFTPYHEDLLMKDRGTIFRFPLRNYKSTKTSSIRKKAMSKEQVRKLLESFKEVARDSLLFLKNVEKIILSDIQEGKLITSYSVCAKMTEENISAKQNLFKQRHVVGNKLANTGKCEFIVPIESAARIAIVETEILKTGAAEERNENWFVVERIGSKNMNKWNEITKAYEEKKLGLIPEGGVAVSLSTTRNVRHKAFCFLPLPIETGLPMHINGHFALNHESRRSLWEDDKKSFRVIWNEFVMSEIIAPAYITAMEFRRDLLSEKLQEPTYQAQLRKHLQSFQTLFPDSDKLADNYWKYLSKEIYSHIAKGKVLLPMSDSFVVEKHPSLSFTVVKCSVQWIPLRKEGCIYSSVFCLNERLSFDPDSIPNMMKRIRFKVVDFSERLFKEFKGFGIPVDEISPKLVINFLKSHGSSEIGSCQVEGVGGKVENSSFSSVFNVQNMLLYCKDESTFHEEVRGLPICVRNDGLLQTFTEKNPLYCTRYCNIFAENGEKFLHRYLSHTLGEIKTGCLKSFSLEDFSSLLGCILCVEKFAQSRTRTEWNMTGEAIPNKEWLTIVWEYFADILNKTEDKPDFAYFKVCIGEWKLLPTTRKIRNVHYLEKINCAKTIIETYSSPLIHELRNSLEDLDFPVLENIFTRLSSVTGEILVSEKAFELARNCVVSLEKSMDVLDCIVHHLRNSSMHIAEKHCTTILAFFNNSLGDLKEYFSPKLDILKEKLRSIPVYVTIDELNTSLRNMQAKVFVLPSYIPHDGIHQWAELSQIILLKQDDRVRDIHNFLGLEICQPINIYACHIIPEFLNMPRASRIVHLEFIKDELLNSDRSFAYNQTQKCLIGELNRCPFLEVNSHQFCASSFVCPFNKLFQVMCTENEFPPEPFNKKEWKKFMTDIGMTSVETPELFLRFAREIAEEGMNTLTKGTLEKTTKLLEHLMRRQNLATELKDSSFNRIKFIKFIPPHKVSEYYISIHDQLSTTPLISFDESGATQFDDVLWTSLNIIPWNAMPKLDDTEQNNAICEHLGIQNTKPPTEHVVKNLQNISDSLKENLQSPGHSTKRGTLKHIFEAHYRYLLKGRDSNFQKYLKNKPIIYVPKEHKVVKCEQVVYRLDDEDEIKPYLFSLPDEFVKYLSLFESLGTEIKVSANHYAKVLAYLRKDSILDDGTWGSLEPNERKNILYPAVKKLFKKLRRENLEVKELFLPNRLFILEASNTLIVSDNEELERRAARLDGRQFFVGFKGLELERTFPDEDFILQQVPKRLRPIFLSDVVDECIVNIEKIKAGDNVRRVIQFLRTEEFIDGILRLLLDDRRSACMTRGDKEYLLDDDEQRYFAERITRIQIQEVTSLTTVLYYKGRELEDSNDDKVSFADCKDDVWTLYCCDEGQSSGKLLDSIQLDFIKILTAVTNGELRQNKLLASVILGCLNDPDLICSKLDKNNIRRLPAAREISSFIFPPPGTFVPSNMYDLLDNTFSELVLGDYAAMLLYEEDILPDGTANPPAYIYVLVKACLGDSSRHYSGSGLNRMQSIYLLDVGESEEQRVPAFKIFKFQRRRVTTSKEVQPAVQINNPLSHLQLDVIFVQVRRDFCDIMRLENEDERRIMMRRLRATWHPDQNFGNEAQATKVFQFIEELLMRVRNGESIDGQDFYRGEDIPTSFRSYAPPPPSSHGFMSHGSNAKREKVQVPQEAKRWLLQAGFDRNAAVSFNPTAIDIPAYNWICYMCHQAVEKALKAMWYNIDANNVTTNHDLSNIAQNLPDPELCTIARELEGIVGYHTQMRYPDQHSGSRVPSLATIYSQDSAEKCIQLAERTIDIASAFING
ncbi:hypothetical protein FSP39_020564, partial [Pinctada imbricata]